MEVRELDIMHIIKTIHKLKAGLSAVIVNDDEAMKLSRKLYIDQTKIFVDCDHERKSRMHNKFFDFL